MKKGYYGYCLQCMQSFDDLVGHKRDLHPRGYKEVFLESGSLNDNAYSGRLFLHKFCGRLIRVSRDWDHKNPQAQEPPAHDECRATKRIPKQSGIGSILVVAETGEVVDDGMNSLPVIDANEFKEMFEPEYE